MDKPQLLQGVQKLETRLKGSDRVFTVGDAAAITGYGMHEAKELLDSLMNKYDCRLKVTENGDLIYDFGSTLHPRGERTWAEWWYDTKKVLWKVFVVVFKVWITVMLVVYFTLFLLILIGIIIAMMSSNNDNDSRDSSSAGDLFIFIGELFRSIFIWNTITGNTYYATDPYGYSYRSYEPRSTGLGKKKKGKNFVASVYDFVFGPPRVETNPLENQQEVASYVRQNKGVIVMPEVLGLAGWTGKEAEDFFSEVLVRYKGDSAITENGILYGDFYDLARSQSSEGDASVVWYWNEYEPEYKLTGNKTGRNAGIVAMNLFNLAFATFFLVAGNNLVFLGWIPFVFSFLFFLVPALRYFQMLPLRRKRHMENIRKRLMKVIYQSTSEEISLNTLLQTVNQANKEEKLSKEAVESMMQTLIYDLNGEIEIKEDATVTYKFIHLKEQIQEAERLRALRDSGKDLGNVVFDTND